MCACLDFPGIKSFLELLTIFDMFCNFEQPCHCKFTTSGSIFNFFDIKGT